MNSMISLAFITHKCHRIKALEGDLGDHLVKQIRNEEFGNDECKDHLIKNISFVKRVIKGKSLYYLIQETTAKGLIHQNTWQLDL